MAPLASWGNAQVKIVNGPNTPECDSITPALLCMDYVHHEIHEGDHYYISGFATMTSGQSMAFVVTAPTAASHWAHMTYDFSSSQFLQVQVASAPSNISGGSVITGVNSNRNSTNVASMTASRGVTIGYSGTVIGGYLIGASSVNPNKGGGGSVAREDELVLKEGETYQWRLVAPDGGYVSYRANWYEHQNS